VININNKQKLKMVNDDDTEKKSFFKKIISCCNKDTKLPDTPNIDKVLNILVFLKMKKMIYI
jgi:hypothetical protein